MKDIYASGDVWKMNKPSGMTPFEHTSGDGTLSPDDLIIFPGTQAGFECWLGIEGHQTDGAMGRRRENSDYIEWDSEAKAPARREEDESPIESLFDAEIRRRIGELIARAADGTKKTDE